MAKIQSIYVLDDDRVVIDLDVNGVYVSVTADIDVQVMAIGTLNVAEKRFRNGCDSVRINIRANKNVSTKE